MLSFCWVSYTDRTEGFCVLPDFVEKVMSGQLHFLTAVYLSVVRLQLHSMSTSCWVCVESVDEWTDSQDLFSLRLEHLLCGDRENYFKPSSNTALTGLLSAAVRTAGPQGGPFNSNNSWDINLPIYTRTLLAGPDKAYLANCSFRDSADTGLLRQTQAAFSRHKLVWLADFGSSIFSNRMAASQKEVGSETKQCLLARCRSFYTCQRTLFAFSINLLVSSVGW